MLAGFAVGICEIRALQAGYEGNREVNLLRGGLEIFHLNSGNIKLVLVYLLKGSKMIWFARYRLSFLRYDPTCLTLVVSSVDEKSKNCFEFQEI